MIHICKLHKKLKKKLKKKRTEKKIAIILIEFIHPILKIIKLITKSVLKQLCSIKWEFFFFEFI